MMEIDLSVLAANTLVQFFFGWLGRYILYLAERWLWRRAGGSSRSATGTGGSAAADRSSAATGGSSASRRRSLIGDGGYLRSSVRSSARATVDTNSSKRLKASYQYCITYITIIDLRVPYNGNHPRKKSFANCLLCRSS